MLQKLQLHRCYCTASLQPWFNFSRAVFFTLKLKFSLLQCLRLQPIELHIAHGGCRSEKYGNKWFRWITPQAKAFYVILTSVCLFSLLPPTVQKSKIRKWSELRLQIVGVLLGESVINLQPVHLVSLNSGDTWGRLQKTLMTLRACKRNSNRKWMNTMKRLIFVEGDHPRSGAFGDSEYIVH